jgi:integrase
MGRRRKRRAGVTQHPGVSKLRPTKSRPYWRLTYRDATGEVHRKSTRTRDEAEATRLAVELSERLEHLERDDTDISWSRFTERYEREHMADKSRKTLNHWKTAANWYVKLIAPQFLDEVTTSSVSRFAAKLRKALIAKQGDVPETTIGSYLKMLRAAFRWAHWMGMLARVPRITVPDTDAMRSRGITKVEFQAIIDAAEVVRKHDYQQWQRFLWGLWESGFRVGELIALSWDAGEPVSIDMTHKYPLVRFASAGQKSRKQQLQPISPEFWDLIRHTPVELRHGPVFPMRGQGKHSLMGNDWIIKVIRKIGKQADVSTGLDRQKWATSHDIGKRSLTSRLADKMGEMDVAKWQRHKDSKTTRKHYHFRDAEQLAEQLWGDQLPDKFSPGDT